ncbi:hypothetical protein BDW22DRAFT_1349715 [Trametopsis cervina]|nr:hypothetical protein BDW22DRAFT_1349715 [Trametopsis cervina]
MAQDTAIARTEMPGLATVVLDSGIRCYTSVAPGNIREARVDMSFEEQQGALLSGNRAKLRPDKSLWRDFPGPQMPVTDQLNNICTLSKWSTSGSRCNICLFYQGAGNEIQYLKQTDSNRPWTMWSTGPGEEDTLPLRGTSIAGVSSKRMDRIALFYQNEDDIIIMKNWTHEGKWSRKETCLWKAAHLTGIAATTCDDATTAMIYWQDPDYTIRESRVDLEKGVIENGELVVMTKKLCSTMAAVSWKLDESSDPDIRLYCQKPPDSIMEFTYSLNESSGRHCWTRGSDTEAIGVEKLTAFVRESGRAQNACVNLMWICKDDPENQVYTLQHRAYITRAQNHKPLWFDPAIICKLGEEGTQTHTPDEFIFEELFQELRMAYEYVQGAITRFPTRIPGLGAR